MSIDITRGFIAAVILLAFGRDQVKVQRPFRSNQVTSVEQLIDMLALLKEVTCLVNFSQKLEGNNGRKGRNFARKYAANSRSKIRGEVPRAANFRSKVRGVETIAEIPTPFEGQ